MIKKFEQKGDKFKKKPRELSVYVTGQMWLRPREAEFWMTSSLQRVDGGRLGRNVLE